MWIKETAPEGLAELFHKYQCAFGVFGPKGRRERLGEESLQRRKTRRRTEVDEEFEWVESL